MNPAIKRQRPWATGKPKLPGPYWYRAAPGLRRELVLVSALEDVLVVARFGVEGEDLLEDHAEGEWSVRPVGVHGDWSACAGCGCTEANACSGGCAWSTMSPRPYCTTCVPAKPRRGTK